MPVGDFMNWCSTAVLPVLATRNATDQIHCFSLAYQIIDVVSYTWAMVTVSMTHITSFMQGCDNPQYQIGVISPLTFNEVSHCMK